MTLAAVPIQAEPAIPSFEGKVVATTKVKLVSSSGLEIDNAVLFMDDIASMKVELRCVGVNHIVDARGDLVRVQTLKVLEAEFTPFVEGQDSGIFRG